MRPESGDVAYLWDMRDAAQTLQGFVAGVDEREYAASRLLQAGVERQIEIIGEAARRVSETFRTAHPEIPWRGIIAQRNVVTHDYGEVLAERIWNVAKERIPELIVALNAVMPPIEEG
ncbi:MAG TPA: HepT-like ribonuclease domain-containing protein [Chloroflexota bacterium]